MFPVPFSFSVFVRLAVWLQIQVIAGVHALYDHEHITAALTESMSAVASSVYVDMRWAHHTKCYLLPIAFIPLLFSFLFFCFSFILFSLFRSPSFLPSPSFFLSSSLLSPSFLSSIVIVLITCRLIISGKNRPYPVYHRILRSDVLFRELRSAEDFYAAGLLAASNGDGLHEGIRKYAKAYLAGSVSELFSLYFLYRL